MIFDENDLVILFTFSTPVRGCYASPMKKPGAIMIAPGPYGFALRRPALGAGRRAPHCECYSWILLRTVSFTNSRPITTVISEITIGYHRP